MQIRKRILAALMSVLMLFSLVPLGVFAEETATGAVNLTDIDAGSTVGKAVTELVKLGIINGYEDGTFRADNTITRGEVSKIIISFLGQESIAFDTVPSGFPDVDDAAHWAKKYIKLAADQKIVNGYTDGTFQPDAPVRYTEIVKMLVCSLGYGDMAQRRTAPGAPWYSGYMAVAAEQGILKNASVNNVEDYASRGTVAILTNNCLRVEIIETDADGNIISDSQTALDKFQGKEQITGIVTGVPQTGIYGGDTSLAKDRILVEVKGEEKLYNVPEGYDTMSILGRKISAYVEPGMDDTLEISQITITKTEEVRLTSDMIETVSDGIVTYYAEKGGRAQKMGIEDVEVIYNGKHDATYDTDDFGDLGSAIVELICNDGDGDAEVAFVTEYENFVVNSADKNMNPPKVYGKYNAGTLEIPYKNSGVHFSLTKQGNTDTPEAIINSLSQWNVISVMRSKPTAEGKGIWNGVVSTKKVTGKITEVDGDGRRKIGNAYYAIADNYARYTGTKPEMKLGEQVSVYLDMEGKIAAATVSTAQSTTYLAFLIDADKEAGKSGSVYATFYGITGTTKRQTMVLADPVTIDGELYREPADALKALEDAATIYNEGKAEAGIMVTPYSQMIRYSKTSAGKIDTIDTILNKKNSSDLSLDVSYPQDNTVEQDGENVLKHTTSGRFENGQGKVAFIANSSTKVLEIPMDVTDTSKYFIRNSFTSNTKYQMEAFNVGSTKIAKYAISYSGGIFAGSAAINTKSPIMIATEVSSVRDDETAEIMDRVSGLTFPGGSAVDVRSTKEEMLRGKYQQGDMFRYAVADGEVSDTQQLIDFGTTKATVFNCDGVEVSTPLRGELEEVAKAAKEARIFKVDTVLDSATAGGFLFGTAMGFEKEENGQMSLSLVPTIKEDEGGIQRVDEFLFDNVKNAKVFLYDYTAVKDDMKVQMDVSLEGNIQPYSITNNADSASQILVYYTGSYNVKAIIIFRY